MVGWLCGFFFSKVMGKNPRLIKIGSRVFCEVVCPSKMKSSSRDFVGIYPLKTDFWCLTRVLPADHDITP